MSNRFAAALSAFVCAFDAVLYVTTGEPSSLTLGIIAAACFALNKGLEHGYV